MAAAPEEDIAEFTKRLLYLEAVRPLWITDYINKSNGGRKPYDPWPPEQNEVEKFLLATSPLFQAPEEKSALINTLDPKKLEDIVAIFDEESGKIEAAKTEAERRAHRMVIQLTIEEQTIDPNKKPLLGRTFADTIERSPEKPPLKAFYESRGVVEVEQAATPIPSKLMPNVVRFSNLKDLNPVQKTVAPVMDRVTGVLYGRAAPEHKEAVINTLVVNSLDNFVNAEKSTKGPDKITTSLGGNVVNEPAFKKLQIEAKNLKTQASVQTPPTTSFDNFAVSSLRGSTDSVVIAWTKLYVKNYKEGLPTPSISQLQWASVGWGSSAIRMGVSAGTDVAIKKTVGAALKSFVTKLGIDALVPGPGWLKALFDAGGFVLGIVGGWFKGFAGFITGFSKDDLWMAALVCAPILLMVFSMGFIQTNFNASLTSHLQPAAGGAPGPEVNQNMDVTIAASPASSSGNRPTSMNYTACVKPKGSPFKLNSASVNFNVYGAKGGPVIAAPNITPDMLTSGCYPFTIPFGPDLQDTVVTATFTVNADVGLSAGVTGTSSVSTVIGNPSIDILLQGGAGVQPGGWCDKDGASTAWSQSDWSAIVGAMGTLAQYPAYLNLVRQYNPNGITVYRINWSGNYWGCTGTDNNGPVIYLYNNAIPNATYILAHELGHRIADSPWFCEFKAQGIMSEGMTNYAKGQQYKVDEDFAEQFAQYVTSGASLQNSLPKHYNFVQQVFGLAPAVHSPGCGG